VAALAALAAAAVVEVVVTAVEDIANAPTNYQGLR
jgi:hypothetical protein